MLPRVLENINSLHRSGTPSTTRTTTRRETEREPTVVKGSNQRVGSGGTHRHVRRVEVSRGRFSTLSVLKTLLGKNYGQNTFSLNSVTLQCVPDSLG